MQSWRYRYVARFAWLAAACYCTSHAQAQMAPEKAWRDYVTSFLSPEYVEAHFHIENIYRSPAGPATVQYVIRYGEEFARTRTAGQSAEGNPISGVARISEAGEVQAYFGPRREYRLLIERREAESILRANGCVVGEDVKHRPEAARRRPQSAALAPPAEPAGLVLFIGDYFDAAGRYSPDHIAEGFYWSGGRHPKQETGTECIVDAETGEFRFKLPAPR